MHRTGFILIIIVTLGLFGCNPDKCFHSTGELTLENRTVDDFSALIIYDVFDVEIIPDTLCRVELWTGEKLLPYITTKLQDSALVIKNENECNWLRSFENRPQIRVFCNNFQDIRVEGEIDLEFKDTLHTDIFTFHVWSGLSTARLMLDVQELRFSLNGGSGEFYFDGKTRRSNFHCDGNGYVFAQGLASEVSSITHISTGDVYVSVTNELNARLLRSGDVYYSGEPVSINIVNDGGTGQVYTIDNNN